MIYVDFLLIDNQLITCSILPELIAEELFKKVVLEVLEEVHLFEHTVVELHNPIVVQLLSQFALL